MKKMISTLLASMLFASSLLSAANAQSSIFNNNCDDDMAAICADHEPQINAPTPAPAPEPPDDDDDSNPPPGEG